jgi:hypothetical protein
LGIELPSYNSERRREGEDVTEMVERLDREDGWLVGWLVDGWRDVYDIQYMLNHGICDGYLDCGFCCGLVGLPRSLCPRGGWSMSREAATYIYRVLVMLGIVYIYNDIVMAREMIGATAVTQFGDRLETFLYPAIFA